MPNLINEADANEIRRHFETNLTDPVELDLYLAPDHKIIVAGRQDCEYCQETRQLLTELSGLTDKLTLRVHEIEPGSEEAVATGVEEVPAIVIHGKNKGNVRFLGIPSGYEFATLLASIVDASKGTPQLSDDTIAALNALDQDVHIRVFVTPTCPYCPSVAHTAHKMAASNSRIKADVVEVSEFPDMGNRFRVRGVPKTVINGSVEFVGAQPEAAFLNYLKQAVVPQA